MNNDRNILDKNDLKVLETLIRQYKQHPYHECPPGIPNCF